MKGHTLTETIKRAFRKCLMEWDLETISDEDLASRKVPVIFARFHHDDLENILNVGFDRVFAGRNGTMVGVGLYSSYYLDGAQSIRGQGYGDDIMMCKLIDGYKSYLFFTEVECQQFYGQVLSIEEQLRIFTNDESIINTLKNVTAYNFGKFNQELASKIGIVGMVYDWNNSQGYGGSNMAHGGRHHGHVCVLPFNFKRAIPFKYSEDEGKTWKNVFSSDVRKRFSKMEDAEFKLKGRNYAKVFNSIHVAACNRNFARVKKSGWPGKYNIVELKTLKEISPYDFDSVTAINPEDGSFQAEYEGKFFDAWVWNDEIKQGFFCYNGEYYTFDDLPEARKGTLKESLKKIFRKILKEETQQETVKYQGKYDFPTPEQVANAVNDPENKRRIVRGGFVAFTVAPKENVENIFKIGFDRSFKGITDAKNTGEDRSWYGDGVYCNIKLERALESLNHYSDKYGDALIECIIVGGIDRFLIFDEYLAKKVYGKNYSDYRIKSQVYKLFCPEDANKVWADMQALMNSNDSDKLMTREEHHFTGQTSIMLQKLLRERYVGRQQRNYYEKLFAKNNVRGVIYTGGNDGLCVVSYDFNAVMPIAVYNPATRKFEQGGNIVDKRTLRETNYHFEYSYVDSVERMSVAQDSFHQFGEKFKDYGKVAIKAPNAEGEMTTYKRVTTHDGKLNYIDASTGEKISDIDFSTLTIISPSNDYMFQFEIGENTLQALGIKNYRKISQITFDAVPFAYHDPLEGDDGWYTFDDLLNTLKNIDTNITNTTSNKTYDLNNPLGQIEDSYDEDNA